MSGPVNFGIFLPAFSKGTSFELTLAVTKLAEQVGLNSVWICDHLLGVDSVVEERTDESSPVLESTVTLAALARETIKVRLGTAVSCIPYRNPALFAKQIATLDVISGGRIELGVGAGWREREFHAYGIPFDPFPTRLEKTREGLYMIRKLLTEKSLTFQGKYFRIRGCQINPPPIQNPSPPIWLGAIGRKIMSTLLPLSNGWLPPAVSIDFIRSRRDIINDVESRTGKKIRIGIEFYTVIDKNRELAIKRGDAAIKEWFGYSVDEIEKLFTEDATMQVKLSSSPFRVVGKPALAVGSPDDCIDILEQYIRERVDLFVLHFMPPTDSVAQLKMYAEKVIPYIRQR